MSNIHLELHLPVSTTHTIEEGTASNTINAVDFIHSESPLSKQQIKQAMSKGAVWITRKEKTQRLRRSKKVLQNDDILHVYYDQKILSEEPLAAKLLADENAYSIWYKPYGMYCQGSKWGDHCTISRWVEQKTKRPTYIVHRLDRATTGLIIVSHKKKCLADFTKIFQRRELQKSYRAIVHGQFPPGPKPVTINNNIDSRTAISHVKLIRPFDESNQSLVEVQLETGRKHQIRRHLSQYGFPIVGDRLYGRNDDKVNLRLCSWYLSFVCPIQQTNKTFNLQETHLSDISDFRA